MIFRSIKYSETSIITDIFTEQKGLRTYIISGVRQKNSRVSASLLQVMTLVDLVVYHRDDKDMTRIKEIKAAHVYQSLPFNITKSSVGQFMLELTRKAIREPEENTPMFDFVFECFQFLDETQLPFSNLHLYFMLRLSGYLGFMPEDNFSKNHPFFDLREGIFVSEKAMHGYFLQEEQSQLVHLFLTTDLTKIHELKITRDTRKELLKNLITFYRLHIENFPDLNSHQILEEVLD